MMFATPQSMAHLAQILRDALIDIRRTVASLESGAGIGTSELIRGAYDYAGGAGGSTGGAEFTAKADAKGIETLKSAQELAHALRAAEAEMKELIRQTREAAMVVQEADARLATQVAQGNAFRV